MRCVTNVPAQQLQSVALRYRGVMERRWPSKSRRWWRDVQPTHWDGSPSDSEDPLARRQRVEAVLLLSREPLNSRKLAQYARLADGTEARTVVRKLNQLYDESGRAFRVEEVAGGFRLLTRRHFAPWLQRLEHVPAEVRLSAPALETLAVVAYRQPALRAEIEAIRGVTCGEILRQLMERDLVRIGGRSDELGRPYLYTTTKRFLQLFGLQNLDELPRAIAIRDVNGSADPRPAETVITLVPADEALLEQEKSEVSVTSPTQLPVDELLEEMSSKTASTPQAEIDGDEYDGDEYEDDEADDIDDDVDDEEDDDFDDDDTDDDFDDDDGFEEDEWEEVDDDDDDDDDEWDEDEDDEWEDDDEDEDDDDDDDDDDDEDEDEDDDDDEWE